MLQFYYNEQNRQTIGAFGTRLKELRRKYNITQIQLATAAVTTYQRISDYETAKRKNNTKNNKRTKANGLCGKRNRTARSGIRNFKNIYIKQTICTTAKSAVRRYYGT